MSSTVTPPAGSSAIGRGGAWVLRNHALVRAPIWLYRARLGFLSGSRTLMLEHVGRKSGARRFVVLEVVGHPAPDTYVVASGFGERAQWFRNLIANPQVRVSVAGAWAARRNGPPAAGSRGRRGAGGLRKPPSLRLGEVQERPGAHPWHGDQRTQHTAAHGRAATGPAPFMKGARTAPANARRINVVPRSGAMQTQRPAPSASAEMEPFYGWQGNRRRTRRELASAALAAGAVCAEPLTG